MTGPRAIPRHRILERDWERTVTEYAKLRHWDLRYHTQRSIGSESGFPDWVLVRERIVYVELKGDGGRARPAQQAWHNGLRAAGGEAYIWWPGDWPDVERILR